MQLKLFSSPVASQLTRLFGATKYDTKSVYMVALASGKTIKDLNQCLNFHAATGAGYIFDTARLTSTGVGTLLGSSTDCTRTIAGNVLSVSEININATASGKPTHIILGGIVPLALEIGTDINLLYPNSNTVVDVTSVGSIVYCPAFNISLPNLTNLAPWLSGPELFAVDSTVFGSGSFNDYVGNAVTAAAAVTNSTTDGIGLYANSSAACLSSLNSTWDVSQSFTIDFKYRQESASKLASLIMFSIYSSNTVRWAMGIETSSGLFSVWNQQANAKVSRPIEPYAALKSTTFVNFKYVYDAATNLHRVFIDGVLVDSFTYVNIKPAATTIQIGATSGYDATVKPYMDNIRVRQGVFL